jgi:hypothetical protein
VHPEACSVAQRYCCDRHEADGGDWWEVFKAHAKIAVSPNLFLETVV